MYVSLLSFAQCWHLCFTDFFYFKFRLLACDNIDCKGKVKAQFCNEAEVNEKFNSGNWDSPCDIKLKAKTDESTFEKKKALATFKKMEIEKFERKPDVQVCEDKFRIVFTTKVKVADQEILVAVCSIQNSYVFSDVFSLL